MKAPKTAPWVIGTTLLSVLILAMAWMFGVQPQLQQADQARADAENRRAQNVTLERRLEELREQAEHLPEYLDELDAIALQIPAEDGEPDLIREIDAAAAASGVFVVKLTSESPETAFVEYGRDASAVTRPRAAVDDDAEGAADDEADDDPAVSGPAPVHIEGFVAVPFTVTVLAPYENTVAFVERLQTSFTRLFVVTGFVVEGQKESAESGGRPATAEGDAEFAITGYVYVLQEDVDDAGGTGTADQGGTVDT